MDNQLIPAHVLFARWFIRIRWAAIVILLFANWAMNNLFQISIQEKPIYLLTIVLCSLNILPLLILRIITTASDSINLKYIKNSILIQIITDLIILALILHYSGGICQPFICENELVIRDGKKPPEPHPDEASKKRRIRRVFP